MIRPQKVPIRPVYSQSSANELVQTSNNPTDITSYIGKILTFNYHQVVVEDILGQGGFAFVFLVRSYNQQRYALKRMYVNNQRDLHVCEREIAIIKEFSSHPNIVKYIDSYVQRSLPTRNYYPTRNENDQTDDDSIYEILLLTEYCSNGSLINRLNEQRSLGITLHERQILRIFADVCNAVSVCHFRRPQPILHRDIKLENILIDSQQNYVLCDFGSAIMLPSSPTNDYQQYKTNELTTNIIQQIEEEIQRYTTLSYRAPEMVDLYSRTPLTLKIDIWAMGCLLYKLMYSTMPFGESILAIQNGTFIIPDDMAQVYSRELNLFVRYMLEIDINKRPDIWQVSYMTYKLLGTECRIPNRCQSKIPNLNSISMPLTESESRHQRTVAATKSKPTPKPTSDESLPIGTAVNPRERPRGIIAPSTSLINFNQPNQQRSSMILHTPTNTNRSESATQLMFDDDFSKVPSHAISLNNISTVMSSAINENPLSRARPSPPVNTSTTSGIVSQQGFFPPPPAPGSNVYTHRRSASQTTSPTNNQSSFHNASSVDSSSSNEEISDDETNPIRTNLDKLQLNNYSTLDSQFNSDDEHIFDHDKSISIKQHHANRNAGLSQSTNHHPSSEEAENGIHSSFIESSIYQSSKENHFHHITPDHVTRNSFDDEQEIKSKSLSNKAKHPIVTDNNNPFLSAPFHLSPSNKSIPSSTSLTNLNRKPIICDLNSIVIGKRTSAFAPYQKRDINSENHVVTDPKHNPTSQIPCPQLTDVFTNAPFKTKSKIKQSSTINNSLSPPFIDLNSTRKQLHDDSETQQHGYSNLSFNNNVVDEYF